MTKKRQYLFDNPRNVRLVLYILYLICAILLLLDFFIHRHIIHHWEQLLGFYSIYGFLGCTAIVFGSKLLRVLVQQDEDFYDSDESKQSEEAKK